MPSVRFYNQVLVQHIKPSSEMSEKELCSLYIQPWEFDEIMSEAHQLATLIRQEHAMESTSSSTTTYTKCFENVYETCCNNTNNNHKKSNKVPCDTESMRRLLHQMRRNPHRRGLEKYSMEVLQQERTKNKSRHVETILRLQENMWELGHELSDQDIATSFARTSQRSSKRDQRFARAVAIADAACVKLDDMERMDYLPKEEENKEEEQLKMKRRTKNKGYHHMGCRKQALLASRMGDNNSLRRERKFYHAKKSRRVLTQ